MAAGFGLPIPAIGAPVTLAVVHMLAIGWLGLLFGGALLQFVPVLTASRLRMRRVAGPSLVLIVCGLLMLLVGFLSLDDAIELHPGLLPAGGTILGAGLGLLVLCLSFTLLSQKRFGLTVALLIMGLVGLLVAVLSGMTFTALLSGYLAWDGAIAALSSLVPLHAAFGLLGWMTLTAIGVSYRLLAMFMIAPEEDAQSKALIATAILSLSLLILAVVLSLAGSRWQMVADVAALCLGVLLLAFYGHDVWCMVKARRRKALELNTIGSLVAIGFLLVAISILIVDALRDDGSQLGPTAFYLLGMGWLTGLGLSQLFKIIPFLTWLEAYGPVMGRSPVPRVQDLVDPHRFGLWFWLFYLAVGLGASALLLENPDLFQLACAIQFVSIAALCLQFARARLLHYVPEELRRPPGMIRPNLIFASTKE
ncbi:hypothetical protein [Rhizobium alvei]|uniref:Transmembrane protein n=1 Tax=Rhizobium alvei TaxID=1132659 RepID=A0ABT8YSY7_9HYPH|nr:hypothetical protein [Rhizobium alvei]MDO6966886.1 hypothetical protein [Rhizobium alvei]